MHRKHWIDLAKGVAILAVVLDHVLFLSSSAIPELFWKHTYFSVTWFVFLVGLTNTYELLRLSKPTPKIIFLLTLKRFARLCLLYFFISTGIYWCTNTSSGSWTSAIQQLLFFTTQPTYYFVNLLLQLYCIFPILFYGVSNAKNWKQKILLTIAVFALSYVSSLNKHILWPFSPAGNYFGGLFLAVYYLGIFIGVNKIKKTRLLKYCQLTTFIILETLFIITNARTITNIPNVFLILWSLTLLWGIYIAVTIIEWRKHFYLSSMLEFLGRNTYMIYLMHFFVIQLFLNRVRLYPIFLQYILAFCASIVIPILINKAIQFCIKRLSLN